MGGGRKRGERGRRPHLADKQGSHLSSLSLSHLGDGRAQRRHDDDVVHGGRAAEVGGGVADGGGGGLREQGRNGMRDGPPRSVGGGLRLPLSLSRPPCPRPAQARTPPPNTHAQAGGQASTRRRRRGARFPMPIASAAFFEGRPWRHAKPAHVWPAPTQRHTRPRPVCCGTRGGARAAGSDGERGRHSSPTRRGPPSRLLSPARPRARRDAGAAAERAGVRRRETWGGARRVEF